MIEDQALPVHALPGRFFVLRHGETVFNAARRLQSNAMHTPLTRQGFEQAVMMGQALRGALGERPVVRLHISDTGRALQTASLIAEELGIDWFAANRTPDLFEIDMGSWIGRGYDDVEAEHGPITLADHLLRPAPDGEDYPAIAARLQRWIDAVGISEETHIVVMHGISSRVLRGLLAGLPPHPDHGAPIAPSLVQGSIALIENGREEVFFGSSRGTEHA
ncbi:MULTISPECIES: histidine phosphatase family protein [unclassified Novosphingobium]|uniref:histidine phosphatase family protein n=1 Tax=unclassified Novosphingobium TaxID=2644732 RepID=UPI0014946991|nr:MULTISPECIES: histidine phosphatase family protein [unclassified Novosphingobium]MBB3358715.1 putative phosphoglycerate mutase [Novosphingobium sp. BK256]MBB3375076.1 putative phosphoglycerate mutase [Novosphingobium sp. BK280]MBB3379236.1 putative phosphoglycerate mutase [Novosphingobium sp. BK258]MBB3420930.1 putative phosphoglycerate mutase [Novosphingobium sp. BK267]MBB3449497.1 putative phosphoglycerate mutase [Novosphingobium sp. BK352]